jgi:hypothetical protein
MRLDVVLRLPPVVEAQRLGRLVHLGVAPLELAVRDLDELLWRVGDHLVGELAEQRLATDRIADQRLVVDALDQLLADRLRVAFERRVRLRVRLSGPPAEQRVVAVAVAKPPGQRTPQRVHPARRAMRDRRRRRHLAQLVVQLPDRGAERVQCGGDLLGIDRVHPPARLREADDRLPEGQEGLRLREAPRLLVQAAHLVPEQVAEEQPLDLRVAAHPVEGEPVDGVEPPLVEALHPLAPCRRQRHAIAPHEPGPVGRIPLEKRPQLAVRLVEIAGLVLRESGRTEREQDEEGPMDGRHRGRPYRPPEPGSRRRGGARRASIM